MTVQNSVGVKGFHEIPLDMVAGQIDAVASDIGVQAAKTGMLASSAIIETVADAWRGVAPDGGVPLVVDPVCASMHGDPLLHPSALDALRTQLFPLATVVTPNLDEVRLLVGIDVRRRGLPARGGRARCTRSGRDGHWSRAGTCARRHTVRTCSTTAPTSTSSTPPGSTPDTTTAPATPWRRRPRPHSRTGTPCPDAVAFGKRWVTECLRAAYPLGRGHGPVSALFRLHEPDDAR